MSDSATSAPFIENAVGFLTNRSLEWMSEQLLLWSHLPCSLVCGAWGRGSGVDGAAHSPTWHYI